jgi:hypothetical protein
MAEIQEFLKRPLFTVNGMTLTVGALVAIVIAAWVYTSYIRK